MLGNVFFITVIIIIGVIFMDDFFSFLQGFSDRKGNKLKDRMKTTIMRAKKGDKDFFIRTLAADYLNLYNEIKNI